MSTPDTIDTLRQDLAVARTPDHRGWPDADGMYAQVMRAESDDKSISWADPSGPGLFRDLDFLGDFYSVFEPAHLLHMQRIFEARRQLVTARVAAGELRHRTIISADVLGHIATLAPNLVRPTARRIITAAHSGFEILMVSADSIAEALGDSVVGSMISDSFVYKEYWPVETVHESIDRSADAVRDARLMHESLVAQALPKEVMLDRLGAAAGS
jgi:hypothetical protein